MVPKKVLLFNGLSYIELLFDINYALDLHFIILRFRTGVCTRVGDQLGAAEDQFIVEEGRAVLAR